MRTKVPLILIPVLLNAGLLILARGSWLHAVLVLAAIIYVGLPALLLSACGYLLGDRFSWGKDLAITGIAVFVLMASLAVSLIPGYALVTHDIAAARTFCEALIPRIELYHQEHGAYPLEIAVVMRDEGVPYLLRKGRFYWSDGQVYRLDFGDPRGIMNGIGYMSQTGQWHEWD
jgi:hypothetical protein